LRDANEKEKELFEDLNATAEPIFIKSAAKKQALGPLKTKLSFRHLRWTKDVPQNVIVEDDLIESDDDIEPGPCPIFLFMPSKVLVMRMILKAAYDPRNEHPSVEV